MTEASQTCILVVADSDDVGELVGALSEPLPTAVTGRVDIVVTGGGDDALDVFAARRPPVVVVSATLVAGDAASLLEALRGMGPRDSVGVVVLGDREGPTSIAAGVADLAPDRFVARPIIGRALRFAVASALERVLRSGAEPGTSPGTDPGSLDDATKSAQRARWEALADSLVEGDPVPDESAEAAPLPSPPPSWSDPTPPTREPTLIIPDGESPREETPIVQTARTTTEDLLTRPRAETQEPTLPRTHTGDNEVNMIERAHAGGEWSEPMPLSALSDRDSKRDVEDDDHDHETTSARGPTDRNSADDILANVEISDELRLDDFDDDLVVLGDEDGTPRRPTIEPRIAAPEDSDPSEPPQRDFARQLRAKMSMMAQRLFQGTSDPSASSSVELSPRHDHATEIDLASLGDELPLGGGVTEIERGSQRYRNQERDAGMRDPATSPGSWDTQVRERGLPDGGEIVRGVSDAALLVAKMFATGATGRVTFRRPLAGRDTNLEKVVFFDQGRPVFASSSEARDRMGELLVREGKITAAQYERCQTVVAESGRRMGEILVDLGYLKRRELLPAVRRHVEDIVYSLFGWDRGHYSITIDPVPSAERIRLSRHPAALVLEGIRRKLDRSTLERLIGPPSTVIEIADRDRLAATINTGNTGNTGDLATEERAALAAIDGQADLSQVARTAAVDLADVLPLAWGLCVLGLATARRTDTEVPDESTALVGETDLAIDRERVRARWELVTEADYFALLGVRRDATTFEIRRAYQSARRDFASDTFPVDLRRELAQELDDIANVLDEAFRVLRDDRLRGTYLANLIE